MRFLVYVIPITAVCCFTLLTRVPTMTSTDCWDGTSSRGTRTSQCSAWATGAAKELTKRPERARDEKIEKRILNSGTIVFRKSMSKDCFQMSDKESDWEARWLLARVRELRKSFRFIYRWISVAVKPPTKSVNASGSVSLGYWWSQPHRNWVSH